MICRSNFFKKFQNIYEEVLDPLKRVKRSMDFQEAYEVLSEKPFTLARVCNVYEGYKKSLQAVEDLEKYCINLCDDIDKANDTIKTLNEKIKNMETWIEDTKTDSINL